LKGKSRDIYEEDDWDSVELLLCTNGSSNLILTLCHHPWRIIKEKVKKEKIRERERFLPASTQADYADIRIRVVSMNSTKI